MLNSPASLYLIGAGPGDPELITIKSIRILKQADVVLYDALANEELLSYTRPSAIRHFAGKRMGCHYLSQQEINTLIVDYGKRHKSIVRLKGGDSFVFGRAHEEINAARAAGMHVEVVPGISSCLAAPASQLIPLTCRGINESFWVTTGTTKNGNISPDIHLAAKSSATIIILMAMSRLEAIMDIFAAAGKLDTPVAIIQEATMPNEKIVIGNVKNIACKAGFEKLTNPSVIVIGEVVNLHPSVVKHQVAHYGNELAMR
jgi:uroporphyrin-III C-methyltransferase